VSECLLQVSDLSGELALGRLILSVLLLDLGEVLELDGFSLEDSTLHILDHLLLLLAELFVSEFHSVDLFLHRYDLTLPDVRVERILHLSL
jgi:hypothetical protein